MTAYVEISGLKGNLRIHI